MFRKPDQVINLKQASSKQRYILLLIILTLMSVSGLVGSDVYLPALPSISNYFSQTISHTQMTLSVYLFGLSISQLFYGSISDIFGRRKLVLIGMFVYFASSIACVLATSFSVFIVARFFQAIGASAGLVLGRAIVGDCFDAKDSAKVFSTIFPFVGMSPAISPVIGGFLAHGLGWRSTFAFVTCFALMTFLLVFCFLGETLAPKQRKSILIRSYPKHLLASYASLLKQKYFWFYGLVPCFAYFVYFLYISESPFILHEHGFSVLMIGCSYFMLSLTYILGNLVGRHVVLSIDIDKSILIGYLFFVIGGVAFLLSSIISFNFFLMLLSISIVTFGNGFLIPQGTAGLISHFKLVRGSASALLGFFQLSAAASASAIANHLAKAQLSSLGIMIFSVCLMGLVLFVVFKRKCQSYEEVQNV